MTNEREPIISNMAVVLVLIVFLVFLGLQKSWTVLTTPIFSGTPAKSVVRREIVEFRTEKPLRCGTAER